MRDFGRGQNSRVSQNATEGKLKKKEKKQEESTKVGRNCYGSGFTRSRWTGCQAKKGGRVHVARFRKEKSVILPCVTRITRVSLRKVRSVRCSIVATLMWFLFARFRVVARSSVALRLHQWHWIHTDLCKMMSSVHPPSASTRKILCHNGKIDKSLEKWNCRQVLYNNVSRLIHIVIHRETSGNGMWIMIDVKWLCARGSDG